MPSLIPFGFGNRTPDAFGNVHVRRDTRGLPVFRDPGSSYVGRHRAVAPASRLTVLLAWLVGERV